MTKNTPKCKMAAILENGRHSKLNVTISQPELHRAIIGVSTPMFWRSMNPLKLFLTTRNMSKYQRAAILENGRHSKLNVTISQPVLHIELSYVCLHQCFGGQGIKLKQFSND